MAVKQSTAELEQNFNATCKDWPKESCFIPSLFLPRQVEQIYQAKPVSSDRSKKKSGAEPVQVGEAAEVSVLDMLYNVSNERPIFVMHGFSTEGREKQQFLKTFLAAGNLANQNLKFETDFLIFDSFANIYLIEVKDRLDVRVLAKAREQLDKVEKLLLELNSKFGLQKRLQTTKIIIASTIQITQPREVNILYPNEIEDFFRAKIPSNDALARGKIEWTLLHLLVHLGALDRKTMDYCAGLRTADNIFCKQQISIGPQSVNPIYHYYINELPFKINQACPIATLTTSQFDLLKDESKTVAVLGGAGAGKTLCIQLKIVELLQKNEPCFLIIPPTIICEYKRNIENFLPEESQHKTHELLQINPEQLFGNSKLEIKEGSNILVDDIQALSVQFNLSKEKQERLFNNLKAYARRNLDKIFWLAGDLHQYLDSNLTVPPIMDLIDLLIQHGPFSFTMLARTFRSSKNIFAVAKELLAFSEKLIFKRARESKDHFLTDKSFASGMVAGTVLNPSIVKKVIFDFFENRGAVSELTEEFIINNPISLELINHLLKFKSNFIPLSHLVTNLFKADTFFNFLFIDMPKIIKSCPKVVELFKEFICHKRSVIKRGQDLLSNSQTNTESITNLVRKFRDDQKSCRKIFHHLHSIKSLHGTLAKHIAHSYRAREIIIQNIRSNQFACFPPKFRTLPAIFFLAIGKADVLRHFAADNTKANLLVSTILENFKLIKKVMTDILRQIITFIVDNKLYWAGLEFLINDQVLSEIIISRLENTHAELKEESSKDELKQILYKLFKQNEASLTILLSDMDFLQSTVLTNNIIEHVLGKYSLETIKYYAYVENSATIDWANYPDIIEKMEISQAFMHYIFGNENFVRSMLDSLTFKSLKKLFGLCISEESLLDEWIAQVKADKFLVREVQTKLNENTNPCIQERNEREKNAEISTLTEILKQILAQKSLTREVLSMIFENKYVLRNLFGFLIKSEIYLTKAWMDLMANESFNEISNALASNIFSSCPELAFFMMGLLCNSNGNLEFPKNVASKMDFNIRDHIANLISGNACFTDEIAEALMKGTKIAELLANFLSQSPALWNILLQIITNLNLENASTSANPKDFNGGCLKSRVGGNRILKIISQVISERVTNMVLDNFQKPEFWISFISDSNLIHLFFLIVANCNRAKSIMLDFIEKNPQIVEQAINYLLQNPMPVIIYPTPYKIAHNVPGEKVKFIVTKSDFVAKARENIATLKSKLTQPKSTEHVESSRGAKRKKEKSTTRKGKAICEKTEQISEEELEQIIIINASFPDSKPIDKDIASVKDVNSREFIAVIVLYDIDENSINDQYSEELAIRFLYMAITRARSYAEVIISKRAYNWLNERVSGIFQLSDVVVDE